MMCTGGVHVKGTFTVGEEGKLHVQNSRAKKEAGGLRQRIVSGWPRNMFQHVAKHPRSIPDVPCKEAS